MACRYYVNTFFVKRVVSWPKMADVNCVNR